MNSQFTQLQSKISRKTQSHSGGDHRIHACVGATKGQGVVKRRRKKSPLNLNLPEREETFRVERANLTIHQEPTSYQEVRERQVERINGQGDGVAEDQQNLEADPLPPGKKAVGSKWVYTR